MALQYKSTKRIFEKYFKNKNEYFLNDIDKQKEIIIQFEKYAKKIQEKDTKHSYQWSHCKTNQSDGLKDIDKDLQKTITLLIYSRMSNAYITFYFDNDNYFKAALSTREEELEFYNCESLQDAKSFIDLLKIKYYQAEAADKKRSATKANNTVKRTKVKALKQTIIVNKLKEIADENNLIYAYETKIRMIKFYLKISDKDMLQLTIPINNYNDLLMNMSDYIKVLLKMHKDKIRIKTMLNDIF